MIFPSMQTKLMIGLIAAGGLFVAGCQSSGDNGASESASGASYNPSVPVHNQQAPQAQGTSGTTDVPGYNGAPGTGRNMGATGGTGPGTPNTPAPGLGATGGGVTDLQPVPGNNRTGVAVPPPASAGQQNGQ